MKSADPVPSLSLHPGTPTLTCSDSATGLPAKSGGDSHFPPYLLSFPLPGFVFWPHALFLVPRTRERVKAMFYHAYDSYLENAFPYDELRPLTCDGHDTWGR